MASFGWDVTSRVSAFVHALSPFSDDGNTDSKNSTLNAGLDASTTPPTQSPSEQSDTQLHEDWMVVMEEHSSIRTIPVSDVHMQRVRNRPRLTKLWDAVDNSDVFIEQPLVAAPTRAVQSLSYAKVVGPTTESATTESQSAYMEAWRASRASSVDSTVRITRVGRHHCTPPSRTPASVFNGDIVDWLDLCKNDRVTRRYLSRQNKRFK
eukprot:m.74534 g.74534  ORF g.74534 m.74534 type:complete len:208 (+) comp8920_c0_seq1:168-791(+)